MSWNKLLGITKIKRQVARYTGIPTTKSGRSKKINRFMFSGISLSSIMFICLCGCLILYVFGGK